MNAARRLVSVVCPAYQEEDVLPLFHRELAQILATLEGDYRFEIIYVDDGSRDGTLACLRQLTREDPRVRYLSLSRNFGHQAALSAGLEHARGEAVISMDSDLQHPPAILPLLLQQWESGNDVVITIRQEDQQLSLFKRCSSKLFYQAMALVSTTEVRLAAADFRLMSRPAVQAFLQLREQHRFVRGMVQWLGFRSAEVSFMPDQRRAGQSKYTLRRMLRLAGDGLFSFSSVPLRLPLAAGLVVWALGAAHLFGCAVYAVVGRHPLDFGLHYLVLLGQLIGGGLLCGLGILGEYVGRIYDEVKRRPVYLVKEASAVDAGTALQPLQRDAA
jgi:glycosyltransferase involved in cell wall biosynthesis